MTAGEGGSPRQTCPRCGSSAVTQLRAIEHESCGAVKPAAEFRTDDGIVCPDCGATCADITDVTAGTPYTCTDCGRNFSTNRRGESNGIEKGRRDAPAVLEQVRSRLATTPSPRLRWGRRVLAVAVIVTLVSVAAIATVGPSLLGSDRVATRTESGPSEPVPGSDRTVTADSPPRIASVASNWTSYRSIVVFRNDDIQPGYRTDAMRDVDRVFVEENVPVTNGVIPAVSGGTLDRDLCQYLRQRAQAHPETFEYALHGYTHDRRTAFYSGSEFGGLSPERQRALLRNGTAALRSCVQQTPTTFVPPFNTYDNATASALDEMGYTVVSGGGWFTADYYGETGPFTANGTLHLPNTHSFVRNWTTGELHSQAHLERQFDDAYRDGELYVQMLHYQSFTSASERETLRGLIEHMKATEDVAFMSVGEFARAYEAGRLERTDTGWRVNERPSETGVDGGYHDGEPETERGRRRLGSAGER